MISMSHVERRQNAVVFIRDPGKAFRRPFAKGIRSVVAVFGILDRLSVSRHRGMGVCKGWLLTVMVLGGMRACVMRGVRVVV